MGLKLHAFSFFEIPKRLERVPAASRELTDWNVCHPVNGGPKTQGGIFYNYFYKMSDTELF